MSEQDTIQSVDSPLTIQSIEAGLALAGVHKGMTLLVHSSLSSLGWVCGGAVAVVLALENAIGPTGTLVMPTHSNSLSDPSEWGNPPVPQAWWETIRNTMPAFDKDLTPSLGVGVIPEVFRKQRGVLRSEHPQYSFAAMGPMAEELMADHSLDFGLGDDSPLGQMYQLDAHILFLGTDYESNTSFHLSEYHADTKREKLKTAGAPILTPDGSHWTTFQDIHLDNSDFADIGLAFEQSTDNVAQGQIGNATTRLFRMRSCVDFGTEWIKQHR